MNEKEQAFAYSIKRKIVDYSIPVTFKEAVSHASNRFMMTHYQDGTPDELIDTGIELYLSQQSPFYFISKYCIIVLPGVGEISACNLYYFQKEILKTFNDYKKIVINKTRQCLTKENFVMTDRGYLSIKDVKIGDKIQTIKNGKIVWTDVLDFIPQGKKEICRVTTCGGDIITSTLDHKYLVKSEKGFIWKEAKDLTVKDELVSNTKLDSFGTFSFEDDKLAALVGYYLADGKAKSPIFVNTNLDYLKECSEAGNLFINCYPELKARANTKNRKQAYDLIFTSKSKDKSLHRPFLDFKKRFGLDKIGDERVLTEELMNLNEHQMSIMLNRLFAGDGWATYRIDKRRKNTITYEIGLGAPNYKFLKQIEYILKSKYGIACKVQKQNEYKKGFWKLRIQQKQSVLLFIEKIGIYKKTEKIKDVINNDKNFYSHNYNNERIKKIELLNEKQEVYDITTGTHDFLTNGVVVHNCGLSTLSSLIFFWKIVCFEHQWGVVISKDKKSSQDVLTKIKQNIERLPAFLGIEIDFNNVSSVGFTNDSKIDTFARSKGAGRGCSPTICLLDENAFYTTAAIVDGIVSSVQPSLARTGGQLFIVSTPNGSVPGTEGYYYYTQVKQLQDCGGKTNDSILYDISWWEIPDGYGIKPEKGYNKEVEGYIKRDYFNRPDVKREAELFFSQIVKKWDQNDWLKYQRQTTGEVKFRQEILKDFIIVGDTVFSNAVLEKVRNKILTPEINFLGNRPLRDLWIWKQPQEGHRYGIGVDVAKGSGNDSSAIEVIDVNTYEQVAEYIGKCTTYDLAEYIYRIAEYYNNAYVIIECNSIGEAVFNELYFHKNYPNLFRQKKAIKNGGEMWTGWMTTVKSRELVTSKFIDYYYDEDLWQQYQPHSERLMAQMSTWVYKNGRPDHQSNSSHDDALLAMAIVLYNRDKCSMSSTDIPTFFGEDGYAYSGNDIERPSYQNEELIKQQKERMYKSMGFDNPLIENPDETLAWLLG